MAAPAATSAAGSTTWQLQHQLPDGGHIAYRVTDAVQQKDVDIIFLHGLCSDMTG
jgi:hypothetical protein